MSGTQFNAGVWLTHRHVREGRGDRLAVRAGTTLTYAGLSELVGLVTAGLRGLGLRRDDRVLFVTNDDVPMFSGILSAFCGGFVAVPVSTMLGAKELGTIIADCGACVVVASPEYGPQVQEALTMAPEVRHLVCDGCMPLPAPAGITSLTWQDLVAEGERAPSELRRPAATSEDSWALWLYTSGTTGAPKGAMHRHANIRHVCETYGDQVLGIQPDDVCFSIAKLFFAYGIGNSMFFPLSAGAATLLEPRRPTPAVTAERLTADRPTLFFGVPTFYAALLSGDLPEDSFKSVRLGISAGEALPPPLQERFTHRFGVEIIDGIGSTEALHIFLSNRPGEVRPGTTGRPVPGYDIQLRDADGGLVPDGEPGSLHVRGASIALGYWRRTDASRAVFAGEWLSTGDTYVRSPDGYYTCLGRSNDLLKAGGIWVSPVEVESRLLEHPAVKEAAVVGLADEHGLDKPVACVVVQEKVTAEELIQWCRDGLAAFKRPRQVIFLDQLPKTATGKIQRFRIRELLTQEARP
ncbi:benzoate-CoA ligase family protein [Thermocatellispora tengchongensis]|uniref:Benzoate-CoA ligase family protein n=1 Tax=Thermocatellispora tengchongensis TaxID=1073253 RepID=A0A840PPX2_9ACTN|nr:benzoate-CoA ligase family protein [Thermocatellispora tengchongensis]MBB5139821.1 benzoate-CoA ligase family protein [Thermocatellispora tengchongensis]